MPRSSIAQRKPLRRILKEFRDENGVQMSRLECGHSVVFDIDRGFYKRRCPHCPTRTRPAPSTQEGDGAAR